MSTKHCHRAAWSGKETVIWGIAMAWLYRSACLSAKYCRRVLGTDAALSQVHGKHSTVFSENWTEASILSDKRMVFLKMVKRQAEFFPFVFFHFGDALASFHLSQESHETRTFMLISWNGLRSFKRVSEKHFMPLAKIWSTNLQEKRELG